MNENQTLADRLVADFEARGYLAYDLAREAAAALRDAERENARLNARIEALNTIISQQHQSHHFAAGSL